MLLTLLKALVLGLIISAPLGPVGALVIQRTLSGGLLLGFCTGLGAALMDVIFARVAILGITSVSSFIISYQFYLGILVGCGLILFGFFSLRRLQKKTARDVLSEKVAISAFMELSKEELVNHQHHPLVYLKVIAGSLLLNFTNVVAILGMGTALSAFGFLDRAGMSSDKLWAILVGLGIGALFWWFLLAFTTRVFGQRLSKSTVLKIEFMTCWVVMGSGLFCLSRVLNS